MPFFLFIKGQGLRRRERVVVIINNFFAAAIRKIKTNEPRTSHRGTSAMRFKPPVDPIGGLFVSVRGFQENNFFKFLLITIIISFKARNTPVIGRYRLQTAKQTLQAAWEFRADEIQDPNGRHRRSSCWHRSLFVPWAHSKICRNLIVFNQQLTCHLERVPFPTALWPSLLLRLPNPHL